MEYQVRPTLDEFLRMTERFSVIPVWTEVMADRLTPVTAFERLVGNATGFLLESVEGGERWARWSFLGWDPAFTLLASRGHLELRGRDVALEETEPFAALERLLGGFTVPEDPDLPPLHAGAVGYLAYDAVRYLERLPEGPPDDRSFPDMAWQFTGSLAALDRFRQTVILVRNCYGPFEDAETTYRDACGRLEMAIGRLATSGAPEALAPPPPTSELDGAASNMTRSDFESAVERARAYIREGDAYQIVLSQRFQLQHQGDLFPVYRALRLINPSPYLFFLRLPELTMAGSSPELMVRVRDGRVVSRPIAGTRPRGAAPAADRVLENELLADAKERAEHVMLVDLARNDLGRVATFGSVSVDELMVVERYSHVMHLVSEVSGELREGVGPVDVLRATFPHGTVSGAPKVRAMQIIDELEPVARGPYAGAVGYLAFSGDLDTAITLRTVVGDGVSAWIQAGAGVVADSDPRSEYEETVHKAAGVLMAVRGAEALRD